MSEHYQYINVISMPYKTHYKDSYHWYVVKCGRETGEKHAFYRRTLGPGARARIPRRNRRPSVAAFTEACAEQGKKPATIRRYLTTVALAHRVAKFDNPCTSEPVRHALKELTNDVSTRQRQARGLGWAEIQRFIECAGEGLPATRERALLCVAYDTMARRGEIVAFNR